MIAQFFKNYKCERSIFIFFKSRDIFLQKIEKVSYFFYVINRYMDGIIGKRSGKNQKWVRGVVGKRKKIKLKKIINAGEGTNFVLDPQILRGCATTKGPNAGRPQLFAGQPFFFLIQNFSKPFFLCLTKSIIKP